MLTKIRELAHGQENIQIQEDGTLTREQNGDGHGKAFKNRQLLLMSHFMSPEAATTLRQAYKDLGCHV